MGFLQFVYHYNTFCAHFLLKKASFFLLEVKFLLCSFRNILFVGVNKYIDEQEILEGQRKYFSQVML